MLIDTEKLRAALDAFDVEETERIERSFPSMSAANDRHAMRAFTRVEERCMKALEDIAKIERLAEEYGAVVSSTDDREA